MTDPAKAMQVVRYLSIQMSQISAKIMEAFTSIQTLTNQYLKEAEKQMKEKNAQSK